MVAVPTLREAQPADFETLWKIDQVCFPPGMAYSRAELVLYMRSRGAFTLLAEQQAEAAGFLVAGMPARRRGHIITLDVLPQFRRGGIGSMLLLAAESRLRCLGCPVITLETAADNHSAQTFYRHHGYAFVSVIPRYYHGELDAFRFQKTFSEGAGSE